MRIICIGNRYVSGDSLGMKVYERLADHPLPANVELVAGGLAGLQLLPLLEGVRRVVFVDALEGFDADQPVLVLRREDLNLEPVTALDHNTSFQYLLGVAPYVLDGPLPEILVVGARGVANPEQVKDVSEEVLRIAGVAT